MQFIIGMQTQFVGIVNVTPDSFSDGGYYSSPAKAIAHGRYLRENGASMVDIGGVSTRPDSQPVEAHVEWDRIAEVVATLSQEMPVSVDTFNPEVAAEALASGAVLINDTFGGRSPGMWQVIADHSARIVIMYSGRTIPHGEVYPPRKDLIEHLKHFFDDRITEAQRYGVSDSQIILDPGMGAFLDRSSSTSWELLRRLKEVAELGFPLMVGVSRKGFLRDVAPLTSRHLSLSQRDHLSAVVALHVSELLEESCNSLLFRVHDVQTHVLLFKLAQHLGRRLMHLGVDRELHDRSLPGRG